MKLDGEDKRHEGMQDIRSGMKDVAEKVTINERFIVADEPDQPSVCILDTTTQRTTVVPLCAYRNVRKALKDLFE